jgi:ankyrin repeat protein
MDDGRGSTPLHWLGELYDPSKEHTLDNQCILAKQLIEAGANVNARAQGSLDSHACSTANCTNLDFIQLLLDHGANPNAKDSTGATPLHWTMGNAPGAAKLLLTYSDKTDPDILMNDGRSVLALVRSSVAEGTCKARLPNTESMLFQLKQLEEVERMLVEREALDSGWRG